MEYENKYASKGVAGAGLGLGIAGAALGLMNGNGLGGLFNVGNCAAACSENTYVNRYEAAQAARISFTMGEMGKLRDYVDSKVAHVEHELCDQKVYNATLNGTIGCISGQIAQLMSLTKLVVPNSAICPGWGDVNVTIAPATTTGTGA